MHEFHQEMKKLTLQLSSLCLCCQRHWWIPSMALHVLLERYHQRGSITPKTGNLTPKQNFKSHKHIERGKLKAYLRIMFSYLY